ADATYTPAARKPRENRRTEPAAAADDDCHTFGKPIAHVSLHQENDDYCGPAWASRSNASRNAGSARSSMRFLRWLMDIPRRSATPCSVTTTPASDLAVLTGPDSRDTI